MKHTPQNPKNEIKFNLFYNDKGNSLQQIMETCATHIIPQRTLLETRKPFEYNINDE